MSAELRDLMTSKLISCSGTTSYNPQGNRQVERFSGSIWRTITAAVKSRWQVVLPDILY